MSWALITNDDGIDAPGLRVLAASAVAAGLQVAVAAPASQASGASAALTTSHHGGGIPMTRQELAELPGVPAYGVAAAPAFIAFAAANGWFSEPPSLVLSGVNHGANVGEAIVHSGTVGAALTAGRFGIRALAVSLDCDNTPPDRVPHWDSARSVLPDVLHVLAEAPEGTVLTLNVPDLPPERLAPLRTATLARRGRVQLRVDDGEGDALRVRMVEHRSEPEPGTDAALLAAGHPTLTAVRSVSHDLELPLADLLEVRLNGRPDRE